MPAPMKKPGSQPGSSIDDVQLNYAFAHTKRLRRWKFPRVDERQAARVRVGWRSVIRAGQSALYATTSSGCSAARLFPDEYLKNADSGANATTLTTFGAWRPSKPSCSRSWHSAEYRFCKSDGTYCWVNDEQHVIRDEKSGSAEVVGSWSDITARKTAEKTAMEANQRVADAIKSISEGFSLRHGGPARTRQLQVRRAVRSWRGAAQTRNDLRGDHPRCRKAGADRGRQGP